MSIVTSPQHRAYKMYDVIGMRFVFIGVGILILFLSACTYSPTDYPAAVVVYSDSESSDALEGEAVFVRNMKKNIYMISPYASTGRDVAVHQMNAHQLLMFKTMGRARAFSETLAPFIGAFLISNTPVILRKHPGINAPHVATFDDGAPLKIIAPLYVLNNNTDTIGYNNQRSYWVNVQYTDKDSYTRGWVLITQNTTLDYRRDNIYNSSTIAQVLSGNYIWKEEKEVKLLQKGGGPSDLYNNKYGVFLSTTDDSHHTTLNIKTSDSIVSIPSNQMWPIGKRKVISPTYAISITWDTEKYIDITFANDITQTFVPVSKDTVKRWKIRSDNYKVSVYKYLTAMEVWTSSLFGRITFTTRDSEYTLRMKWQIPNAVAGKIGLKDVRYDTLDAIVYLDYVPDESLTLRADTVLAWPIEDTEYLQIAALKTISRNRFSLQLITIIPVPIDDVRQYTSYIISDIPDGVNMVFTNENIIP